MAVAALTLTARCMAEGPPGMATPFIPDDANSWAFPTEHPDPASPSPIDLRFLNEPVAGGRGPLRLSPDGADILMADGRRFAAWMVHMPHGWDGDFTRDAWAADDYATSARFLARLGVNLGVVGAINPAVGSDDPLTVNPNVLGYVHRAVAAARDAGIYTQLRVAWFHGIKGDRLGVAGHEDKDLQCLVFFHPGVQAAWKSWARQLLTAPDPASGRALKDEPALCGVEIVNEDSLLFYVTDGVTGDARAELERQFHQWAARKYGDAAAALAAWGNAAHPDDRPDQRRLAVMVMWMLTRDARGRANEQRVRDQLAFLVEAQQTWNREARRFIRDELGAGHVLVASSNFVPADRVLLDDALRLLAWRDVDVVQNNHYVADGGKPRTAGWRADAGGFLGLRSAVTDPLGLPTNKRQRADRPFWATEILWPRPHPHEVEGPLLVAAYQSLTGIDGLAWAGPRDVTWERRDQVYFPFFVEDGSMAMRPFTAAGPATLGQFPAAAAVARLGLVRRAEPVVREVRTERQILVDRAEPAIAEEFAYDPTQFGGRAAQDTALAGGVPKEAFLVGPVTVAVGDEPALHVADLSPFIADGVVTSATRELVADTRRGLFTVDAPAAKVAVGFLRDAGEVDLSGVRIRSAAPHGTVAVVALDARPIDRSTRILIQVGARAVPTGWRESPATWTGDDGKPHAGLRVDATGDLPWRVRRADVTVEFPKLTATRATALDGNGTPLPAVPVTRAPTDGGGAAVRVPDDVMYVVLE